MVAFEQNSTNTRKCLPRVKFACGITQVPSSSSCLYMLVTSLEDHHTRSLDTIRGGPGIASSCSAYSALPPTALPPTPLTSHLPLPPPPVPLTPTLLLSYSSYFYRSCSCSCYSQSPSLTFSRLLQRGSKYRCLLPGLSVCTNAKVG